MAITKIHAIKSTLGKALAYIENPDKTDGQMLVSGYNCEPQTASIDFEMTAVLAHKARNLQRKRSTNLAYHLIQSFSPEDAVTPEQAHELGKKLAFEYTGGKYEYVVATHIDKGHIHNHIMINAVSFYDYKKLRTVPYRTARQIRDISDRLCIEAHLSVIDDPQKIGQLYPENAGKKKSVSNRTEIRKRLNFCLERATGYSQFLSMAKELEITPTIRGKHMSYLLEGAGRSVRDNSLSDTDTFTYAGICARLSDNAQEQKYLRRTITGILSTATGMADFADKLKTAGIETKVKKATGQVLYRATVLDGAWVPEDALGSEFTSEGIEYGQCAVSLYPNHQYSYIPTSGENKRNSIQGDQLAAILGVAINPSTENTTLSRRIAAVERRMGIENAKNLGKVLLGMTSENMYTAADYDKAILSLGKKQIDLTNKISAMQEKRKEVAAVTKSLQICKTYKPVWMQYVELPMSQKSAFYSGHSTELQAYSSAAKNLEKEGIDQSVDLDKAIGFTEQLERKIEETKEQLRETNSEEKKAQQERKKVLDIQENHTIN